MTDGALHVRPAASPDIAGLVALARAVWQATYPALISQAQIDFMLAQRYGGDAVRAALSDPRQRWWVAKRSGELAAFAHAWLDTDACKLDKLYVDPAHQRRGVGAALVAQVADWARAHGVTTLRLQVNRANAQAIRAYEKYGFRVVTSQVFDIGDGFVMDDHVMECTL